VRLLLRSPLRRILEHGDIFGHTALHYAASYAPAGIVRLLLEAAKEDSNPHLEDDNFAEVQSNNMTLPLHLGK
jgi:ankyrin repeat protein